MEGRGFSVQNFPVLARFDNFFNTKPSCMKSIFLLLVASFGVTSLYGQVGIGTKTPHASAQLDVTSDSKGILIPRVQQSGRPSAPADGLLIYQTDGAKGFYYFDGTKWSRLVADANSLAAGTGFAGYVTGYSSGYSPVYDASQGVNISLPDDQNLGSGIVSQNNHTEFFVTDAGRYRIAYTVRTEQAVSMLTQILFNGAVSSPILSSFSSGEPGRLWSAEGIMTVPAGTKISLQLVTPAGSDLVTLQSNAQGAALTIQRIE